MILDSKEQLQQKIGMHSTKAWFSKLVNLKDAIWT